MGIRRLIIAGGTVVALLSFIFYVEKPHQENSKKQTLALGGAKSLQLSSIEVKRAEDSWKLVNVKVVDGPIDEASVLASEIKNWRLASLPEAKLDEGPVSSIISSLIDLKTEESFTPEEGQPLSDFGLGEPQFTVTITLGGGSEKKLYFGKRSDYLGKRYLKIDDSRDLFLISDAAALAIDKSPSDLRNKSPISFDQEELDTVTIEGQQGRIILKRADGLWSIQEPKQVSANNLIIGEMLRELRGQRVKTFVDNIGSNLSEWELSNPKLKFQIVKKNSGEGPVDVLLSTGKDGQHYLKLSNQNSVFELEKVDFEILNKDFKALRNRKLFDFDSWRVKKATIRTSNSSEFVIEKLGNEWKVQGEAGDESFISQYFSDLAEVPPIDYLDAPLSEEELKKTSEAFSVAIILDDNKQIDLRVLKQDGKLVGLPHSHPTEQFYLSQESLNKIYPKKETLVKLS